MTSLAFNRYGKHRVRVSKIRRPRQAAAKAERHEFVEASVDIELEGDFAASFTEGDNRNVIATDTCKNTVYVLAKDHPLDTIESFGLAIVEHFIGRYAHVTRAIASLEERVWSRLADSPFCFTAAGSSTPTTVIDLVRGQSPQVRSGFEKLLIAKTTESGFSDFHRDEFRTLPDTNDRILATELSTVWTYDSTTVDFAKFRVAIVDALVKRFTDHYSRSVQETLYLMGQAALAACPVVKGITLTMPNKHHLLANLAPFGRTNENEVFVATDEPFGYITGTVARD
ncbi:MAG: factor-independent urate hydroxylase [Pirellulales bacterium]